MAYDASVAKLESEKKKPKSSKVKDVVTSAICLTFRSMKWNLVY